MEESQPSFSLARLPRELLAQILSPANSYLVIALYLTGNKALNHKIETGGCVDVRLLDRKMDSKSRFPSLLKNLTHLRRLSIVKHGLLLYPYHLLGKELQKLTPTLQALEIDCFGCCEALLRFPDPPATSSDESTIFNYAKGPSLLWNVGECFPALQELRFGRKVKRIFRAPPAPFRLSDLAALPDSLNHVSINLCFEPFEGDLAAILPRNIQNLEVTSIQTSNVTSWPPNLVSLSRMYLGPFLVQQSEQDYDNLGKVPRSLTEISFGTNPIANPSLMAALPPNVRRLKCVTADEAEFARMGLVPWTKALPSRLTALDIDSSFNFDALSCLPRTVCSLSAAIDVLDISDKLCLPDLHLKRRLRLARDETTLETQMMERPNSSLPVPSLDLSFWPPGLKTLGMLWKVGYEVSSEEQVFILPKTLKKLSLRVGEGSYRPLDRASVKSHYFWLHHMHVLCPKLQKFSIFSTHDRPIYFRWPYAGTNIRHLHLDGNYTGAMYDLSRSNYQLSAPQPPMVNLETGEIDRHRTGVFEPFLVPEGVSGFGLDICRLRDALRIVTTALPQGLRRLLLRSGNSSDMRCYFTRFLVLRPSFFAALPSGLLELNLDAGPPALPSCLNSLPTSLNHLMLELRSDFTEIPPFDEVERAVFFESDSLLRSHLNQDGYHDHNYDGHDYYDAYLYEGEDEDRDLLELQERLSDGSFNLSKVDLLQFALRCPKLHNYWPLLDTLPMDNWRTLAQYWPLKTLSHVTYHHDIYEYPEPLQEAAQNLVVNWLSEWNASESQ